MSNMLAYSSPFKPNVIETPSAGKLASLEQVGELAEPITERGFRDLNARAIRLQLRAVQVMDGLQGILGLNIGAAGGVYLVTTVVDGTSSEPIVFKGNIYNNIQNGDLLPFGPSHEPTAVFNVYQREGEMPRALSFCLAVFRSNQHIREAAQAFGKVREDERYQKLSGLVQAAVSTANPALSTVWQVADEIIGLVAHYLQTKPDDQLGYYQANYTNAFDNLGIGQHPPDRETMLVDRIRFAYEINAVAD